MPSAKTATTYNFTMADLAVALNSIGIPFQKGDTIGDTDGGGWLWTYEDSGESLVLEHITEEVSVQPTAPAKPAPAPAEPTPAEPTDLEKAKAKYPVGTRVEIAGAGRFWRPVIITGYEEDRYGSPAVVYDTPGGWDRVKTILDPNYCRPYVEPPPAEPLPRLVQVGDYIQWPNGSGGIYRVIGDRRVRLVGRDTHPHIGRDYPDDNVRLGQPISPYIKLVKVLVPTEHKTCSLRRTIYEAVPAIGNVKHVALWNGRGFEAIEYRANWWETKATGLDLTDYVVLPDPK